MNRRICFSSTPALIIMMRVRPRVYGLRRRAAGNGATRRRRARRRNREGAASARRRASTCRRRTVDGTAPETILATEPADDALGGLFAVNELVIVRQGSSTASSAERRGRPQSSTDHENLQIRAGRIWFRGERIDGFADSSPRPGEPDLTENIRLFWNVTATKTFWSGMYLRSSLRSVGRDHSPHTRRSEKEGHDEALNSALRRAEGPRRRSRPEFRLR